jgi:hypothetical protein
MNKKFLILQPPLSDKYNFLVDDITKKENWGTTKDLDKVEYNINLLGEHFKIDLKIKHLSSGNGLTTVFPLGKFITVLEISPDESIKAMTFFDFKVEISRMELKMMLTNVFKDNTVKAFMEIYDILKEDFNDEFDNVRLVKI